MHLTQLLVLRIPQEIQEPHYGLVPNIYREPVQGPLPLMLASLR